MRKVFCSLALVFLLCCPEVHASVFGLVQGIVHDPQHRPVSGAQVTVRSAHSDFVQTVSTDQYGAFSVPAIPLGDYVVTVTEAGFDPKDIDYLEVQRGSYASDVGDRTYGIFNVVPRTGFEYNKEGEVVLSGWNFLQTNAQVNFGSHTERFAYYASATGSRSDYGLAPPVGQVLHDAANGFGGFASLIYNRTPKDQFRLVTQVRGDFFQIPYDPDPNSDANQQYDSSGLRDSQRERDGLATLSWVHSFSSSTLL